MLSSHLFLRRALLIIFMIFVFSLGNVKNGAAIYLGNLLEENDQDQQTSKAGSNVFQALSLVMSAMSHFELRDDKSAMKNITQAT